MAEESRIDLVLSGVGTASGGLYQNVSIQGVGKVHGDIECLDCSIEGVSTIHGGVIAKDIRIAGKVDIRGDVASDSMELEGRLNISGKCTAERFVSNGSVIISGLLNAGEVRVKLSGPYRVAEIGAESIRVEKERGKSVFSLLKTLHVQTIEADEIYLENTKAKTVRGNEVVIGPGCQIDVVEYRSRFEQHKQSRIGIQRQM